MRGGRLLIASARRYRAATTIQRSIQSTFKSHHIAVSTLSIPFRTMSTSINTQHSTENEQQTNDFALTTETCSTLREYALLVLNTHNAADKAKFTFDAFTKFNRGDIPLDYSTQDHSVPSSHRYPNDYPARPPELQTLDPQQMPPSIKGDHEGNRIRLIHSLAHIESVAIDLSFDMLVRWIDGISVCYVRQILNDAGVKSTSSLSDDSLIHLPHEFFADWLRVACEESRHFTCWSNRLKELDSFYGALPVHNSLWTSAYDTKECVLSRLSLVHGVHEAHGLDCSAKMCKQMQSMGDAKSARLLAYIESDEVTHVAAGLNWFRYILNQFDSNLTESDHVIVWHDVIKRHYSGAMRGPFNEPARAKAGMTTEWYKPLADTNDLLREKQRLERLEQEKAEREQRRLVTKAEAREKGLAMAAALKQQKTQTTSS